LHRWCKQGIGGGPGLRCGRRPNSPAGSNKVGAPIAISARRLRELAACTSCFFSTLRMRPILKGWGGGWACDAIAQARPGIACRCDGVAGPPPSPADPLRWYCKPYPPGRSFAMVLQALPPRPILCNGIASLPPQPILCDGIAGPPHPPHPLSVFFG